MLKRYLVRMGIAILVFMSLAGCAGGGNLFGEPAPTEIPFARFTSQDVLNAFSTAGITIEVIQREMLIGRDAPSTFIDRYTFQVPRIAPSGGQLLIFENEAGLAEWENYISRLRADVATRRDVSYVYINSNALVQVNANLTPPEANQFRDAVASLGN